MTTRKPLVFKTSFAEIVAEVRAVIERHGAQRDLGVLAAIVVNNHPRISGQDRDFHLCASFRAIRKEIVDQLNRYHRHGAARTAMQDDFASLKEGYNIERNGEQLHLRLEELTFEEIMAKADEYDALSRALVEEARELRRYALGKWPERAEEYEAAAVAR